MTKRTRMSSKLEPPHAYDKDRFKERGDAGRMGPSKRGKWDDHIAWLKQFEELLGHWRRGRRASGMFNHLADYDQYAARVEGIANALNWHAAPEQDRDRTMNWIQVGEARFDLIKEMEGLMKFSDEHWFEQAANVHHARLFFERTNEPEESPVKY